MTRKIIFKYGITFSDLSSKDGSWEVAMPANARILSVGLQDELLCIWAEHELDQTDNGLRYFTALMTGIPYIDSDDSSLEFLGTLFYRDLVLHVHERVVLEPIA